MSPLLSRTHLHVGRDVAPVIGHIGGPFVRLQRGRQFLRIVRSERIDVEGKSTYRIFLRALRAGPERGIRGKIRDLNALVIHYQELDRLAALLPHDPDTNHFDVFLQRICGLLFGRVFRRGRTMRAHDEINEPEQRQYPDKCQGADEPRGFAGLLLGRRPGRG